MKKKKGRRKKRRPLFPLLLLLLALPLADFPGLDARAPLFSWAGGKGSCASR